MTTINVEILKKRMEDMSNYDMDEIERLREREKRSRGIKPNWPQSVELGKDETPYTAVDIELSDDDLKELLFRHMKEILLSIRW